MTARDLPMVGHGSKYRRKKEAAIEALLKQRNVEEAARAAGMERISPARRGACIRMNLPPIKTAEDVNKAAEKVTQAIRRGEITPAEGYTWMNILESRSRVIERVQWESRLEAMEARLAAAGLLRAA
jgi:hypothetical protein